MSGDVSYILSTMGEGLQLVYWNGEENWTRMQGGTIRAVAVTRNGSLVGAADDRTTGLRGRGRETT